MDIIEAGQVFILSENNMFIDSDLTVLKDGIPIGSIEGNLRWFKESSIIPLSKIDKIVYLGDYKWSYKHFFSYEDEFNNLTDSQKDHILSQVLRSREAHAVKVLEYECTDECCQ